MTTREVEQQSIFDTHPTLGNYVSHHPSNRLRLLLRGAIFFAIPVAILQILFSNVSADTAKFFLPFAFAGIALAVFWYVAHLWNREVVLYEQGFTYREGSRTGHFRYEDIVQVKQSIQRAVFLNRINRTHYTYTLITDLDERLQITNLYSDIQPLINRLEGFIVRDRLPLIRRDIDSGKQVSMGAGLKLSKTGLEYEGRTLSWHDLSGRRVQDGTLRLQAGAESWAALPVAELDNPVLALAAIKHYVMAAAQ